MGVVIKDMNMPTSCSDCPIGGELGCPFIPGVPALRKEYDVAVRTNRRHSHCPLGPAEELSKPSWISVTERLPEEWRTVLTFQPTSDDKGIIQTCVYIGIPGKWRQAWNHEFLELPVTHWMPLPEPPKEGDKEVTHWADNRLIERMNMPTKLEVEWFCGNKRINVPWRAIEDAPTIIPASKEGAT